MPEEPAPADEQAKQESDPIAAIVEKQESLETLINQGLGIPVYLTGSSAKEIIGVIIQISDNEVISTKFGDLQMQALEITGSLLSDKSSSFHRLLNEREAEIHEEYKNSDAHTIFRSASNGWGGNTKIIADIATEPDLVIEKLVNGLEWLKERQQQLLKNRTEGTKRFNQIINDDLKPPPAD